MAPRLKHRRDLGRPATWDDLSALPEDVIGEIIAGELVVSPRPNSPHAHAASDLGVLLGGPFRFGVGGPGGWVFLDEPSIRFGRDIRVPDLAAWRRERWPGAPRSGPITIAPDWICEVLSRSTEKEDRIIKPALYARERVGYLWLLSPEVHTLQVMRLEKEGWLLRGFADSERVRAEPFDAIELDLSHLWAPLLDEEEEESGDGE